MSETEAKEDASSETGTICANTRVFGQKERAMGTYKGLSFPNRGMFKRAKGRRDWLGGTKAEKGHNRAKVSRARCFRMGHDWGFLISRRRYHFFSQAISFEAIFHISTRMSQQRSIVTTLQSIGCSDLLAHKQAKCASCCCDR